MISAHADEKLSVFPLMNECARGLKRMIALLSTTVVYIAQ